jgi:hypothetical protein
VPQSGWLSGSLADWPAAKGFFDSLVGRIEGKSMQSLEQIIQAFVNDAKSSDMDLCLTIESREDSSAWVQITWDSVNASFPISSHPVQYLKSKGVVLPKGWGLLDYEADSFATFKYDSKELQNLIQFVKQYFQGVFGIKLSVETMAFRREELGEREESKKEEASLPVQEWEPPSVGLIKMTVAGLKPNDKVVIKYDTGEYYADYPSQTILKASRGSVGRIASMEEFKADFIRRLRQERVNREQQQAYAAHFSVVEQAMVRGLQYPIYFEKVERAANANDLLLSQAKSIQLVDGAAVEKIGSGGNPLVSLFGKAKPQEIEVEGIVWPTIGGHDSAKLTDFELALVMSNKKPATREDIEFVYLRYISTLRYHNLWYRLKEVVAEAAYDIIDTLRFPKHNHAGYSWKVVAEMIEKNDRRKSLWYTGEQKEALVVAAQNIYRLEKEKGFDANRN